MRRRQQKREDWKKRLKKLTKLLLLVLVFYLPLLIGVAFGAEEAGDSKLVECLVSILIIIGVVLVISAIILLPTLFIMCLIECLRKRAYLSIVEVMFWGLVLCVGFWCTDYYNGSVKETLWIYVGRTLMLMIVWTAIGYSMEKE